MTSLKPFQTYLQFFHFIFFLKHIAMAAAAAPKSQGRQAQYWFVTLWPELNPALKAALPANGVPTSESVTAYLSDLVGEDFS